MDKISCPILMSTSFDCESRKIIRAISMKTNNTRLATPYVQVHLMHTRTCPSVYPTATRFPEGSTASDARAAVDDKLSTSTHSDCRESHNLATPSTEALTKCRPSALGLTCAEIQNRGSSAPSSDLAEKNTELEVTDAKHVRGTYTAH